MNLELWIILIGSILAVPYSLWDLWKHAPKDEEE